MPFEYILAKTTKWVRGERILIKQVHDTDEARSLSKERRLKLHMDKQRMWRERFINKRRGRDIQPTSRSDEINREYQKNLTRVERGYYRKTVDTPSLINWGNVNTQYVIILQNDKVIQNFGTILHFGNGNKSTLFEWFKFKDRPALSSVSDETVTLNQFSTIYLVGHGDNSYKKLAGSSGQLVAAQFARYFRRYRVRSIQIIGCLTGSTSIAENFTQQFHLGISSFGGIPTPVTGRNRCVAVEYKEEDEDKGPQAGIIDCDAQYFGSTYNATNKTSDVPEDRITYYWEDRKQRWRLGS